MTQNKMHRLTLKQVESRDILIKKLQRKIDAQGIEIELLKSKVEGLKVRSAVSGDCRVSWKAK